MYMDACTLMLCYNEFLVQEILSLLERENKYNEHLLKKIYMKKIN
jgi:hypothetical protein